MIVNTITAIPAIIIAIPRNVDLIGFLEVWAVHIAKIPTTITNTANAMYSKLFFFIIVPPI